MNDGLRVLATTRVHFADRNLYTVYLLAVHVLDLGRGEFRHAGENCGLDEDQLKSHTCLDHNSYNISMYTRRHQVLLSFGRWMEWLKQAAGNKQQQHRMVMQEAVLENRPGKPQLRNSQGHVPPNWRGETVLRKTRLFTRSKPQSSPTSKCACSTRTKGPGQPTRRRWTGVTARTNATCCGGLFCSAHRMFCCSASTCTSRRGQVHHKGYIQACTHAGKKGQGSIAVTHPKESHTSKRNPPTRLSAKESGPGTTPDTQLSLRA